MDFRASTSQWIMIIDCIRELDQASVMLSIQKWPKLNEVNAVAISSWYEKVDFRNFI